jgi:hypothetical protein
MNYWSQIVKLCILTAIKAQIGIVRRHVSIRAVKYRENKKNIKRFKSRRCSQTNQPSAAKNSSTSAMFELMR